MVDVTPNGGGFIAVERTGASAYTNRWDGYIYDFHIVLQEHTIAMTDYASTCSTGCYTIDFDQYD